MEKKSKLESFLNVLGKVILAMAVLAAFYKLPSVIADKVANKRVKCKKIYQDLTEDEA